MVKSTKAILLLTLTFVACSLKMPTRRPISALDNPAFHYNEGIRLLYEENMDSALYSFNQALSLDYKFSRAYSGLSRYYSIKKLDIEIKDNLKKAGKYIKDASDEIEYKKAIMINLSSIGNEKAYAKALEIYDEIKDKKESELESELIASEILLKQNRYDEARKRLKITISSNSRFKKYAYKLFDTIYKVEVVKIFGEFGKEIMTRNSISRAELATLITQYFRLNELFVKNQSKSETVDTFNHPFKTSIGEYCNYAFDMCENDALFEPDNGVTNAEFYSIIYSLIRASKKAKDKSISFWETKSPFSDLDNSHYAYNAVMNCFSIGILTMNDSKKINPDDYIGGEEAMYGIVKLARGLY